MTGTPFPRGGDREAVRAWMRENSTRSETGRPVASTVSELAALQRERLLRDVGAEGSGLERERLDVALTGAATEHHQVRISVLGGFLVNLQKSVQAVAQSRSGRPTAAASVPRWIEERTELQASALFPSSFGLTLHGPDETSGTEGQPALFSAPGRQGPTVLGDAMTAVLDLVDLSASTATADDQLAESLVDLGQRAVKHIGALAAGLAEAEAGLKVAWRPGTGEARRAEWLPDGVRRVRLVCEQNEFGEPSTVAFEGWLAAADMRRRRVEIITTAGDTIRAGFTEELAPSLPQLLDRRVRAEAEMTRVRSAGGRERRVHTVLRLAPDGDI